MKNQNRVIFVCHYFPPQTNVGIRRVLFWANFLTESGYKVTVLTTKKTNSSKMYDVLDDNVEVIEFDFWNASLVNKSLMTKEEKVRSGTKVPFFKSHLTKFKRRFINPYVGQLADHRLIPVIGFLLSMKLGRYSKILNMGNYSRNTIISTVPPWPMHLLGAEMAKKFNANFFADYRDPFSNNHIFSSNLSKIEEIIERRILSRADAVFTVSESWVSYYKHFNPSVHLLRNGYDETMFSEESEPPENSRNKLILNYFGSIEHEERLPKLLIDYVNKCEISLELNFYGSCNLLEEYILNRGLTRNIKIRGTLSYIDTIKTMKNSDVNVVSESLHGSTPSHRGLIPTKIYEYMAAGRPILAIVSHQSDMIPLLKKSGLLINEAVHTESDIDNALRSVSSKKYIASGEYIKSLSRQATTKKLVSLIDGNINA